MIVKVRLFQHNGYFYQENIVRKEGYSQSLELYLIEVKHKFKKNGRNCARYSNTLGLIVGE